MTIGELIQAARKKAGITQVELGKRLGVSGSMIGQWENNLRNPKSETIGKLAVALGDSFEEVWNVYQDDWEKRTVEKLKAIRVEDEAIAQEIRESTEKRTQVIQELSEEAEAKGETEISNFIKSPTGRSIICAYSCLNRDGQDEAENRLWELTEISKYRRETHTEPSETLLEDSGGKDTGQQEKPPESLKKPNDGK